MKKIQTDQDLARWFEELDAWERGDSFPTLLETLATAGVTVPPLKELRTEQAIHDKLWEIINALALLGVYLECTDHLSDRQLYRLLKSRILREEESVDPENPSRMTVIDILGGGSNADVKAYLTYYANEDERQSFVADWEGPFPSHRDPPYDRDRKLPKFEPPKSGSRHEH